MSPSPSSESFSDVNVGWLNWMMWMNIEIRDNVNVTEETDCANEWKKHASEHKKFKLTKITCK